MKFLSIFSVMLTAAVLCAEPLWHTDPDKAQKLAKEENKPLFVLFTAPEWCPPCQKLERDVLSQDDFAQKASEKAVLLQFDLSDMKKVPEHHRKAYERWLTRHGIRTVPTMMLTDAEGKRIAYFNYSNSMTAESLLADISSAAEKANGPWMFDPEAALAKAKAENKPLFVLFTAPGWCMPCRNLEARVLSKNDFAVRAAEIVIPLELDFSDPDRLPAAEKALLLEWAERYSIAGYPTMLVISPDGTKLADIPNLRNLTADSLLKKIEDAVK